MSLRTLNDAFGVTKRRVKGRDVPPPPKVAEVLLARAERQSRKLGHTPAEPTPVEGMNRRMLRAIGERGDRRHGNHPWNTRAVPRGKR